MRTLLLISLSLIFCFFSRSFSSFFFCFFGFVRVVQSICRPVCKASGLEKQKQNACLMTNVLFLRGGERGIRTLGTGLPHTRFPVVRLRPAQPSLRATRISYHNLSLLSSIFFIISKLFSFLFFEVLLHFPPLCSVFWHFSFGSSSRFFAFLCTFWSFLSSIFTLSHRLFSQNYIQADFFML